MLLLLRVGDPRSRDDMELLNVEFMVEPGLVNVVIPWWNICDDGCGGCPPVWIATCSTDGLKGNEDIEEIEEDEAEEELITPVQAEGGRWMLL